MPCLVSGMRFDNAFFITGTAYAGKSTMTRLLDKKEFPCLTYTRDLEDWHDFIRRSPEEYAAWIDGAARECEVLELRILDELCRQGKPVFVDTNISLETLRAVAPPDHVLIMLADPMISVRRFFDRPDREKQFLYRLILEEPDPEAAMINYRKGLERVNSPEKYDYFLHSGFQVILRDETRSVQETLALVEKAFGLR